MAAIKKIHWELSGRPAKLTVIETDANREEFDHGETLQQQNGNSQEAA
jgi:hypothetical protein